MKQLTDFVFKRGKEQATQAVDYSDVKMLPSEKPNDKPTIGEAGDKFFENYFALMERVEKEKDFFSRIRNLFCSRDSRALIVPYEAEKSFSYTMAIENKADKDDFCVAANGHTNDDSRADNGAQVMPAQRSLKTLWDDYFEEFKIKDCSTQPTDMWNNPKVIFYSSFAVFLTRLVEFRNSCVPYESLSNTITDYIDKVVSDTPIPFEIRHEGDWLRLYRLTDDEIEKPLVNEAYDWLESYPYSRTAYSEAIAAYNRKDKASDVADKFRKALETLCQERFDNAKFVSNQMSGMAVNKVKSLENYKSEIGDLLRTNTVPPEISNSIVKQITLYTDYINNYAKHGSLARDNVLEYIKYQTGAIMKLISKMN